MEDVVHATGQSVEDSLKSEVHALEHEYRMAMQQVVNLKADNERLRKWVKEAYIEGAATGHFQGEHCFSSSTACARLEGRTE